MVPTFTQQPAWTPFERATMHFDVNDPQVQASIAHIVDTFGKSREEVLEQFEETAHDEVYLNSRYQVNVRRHKREQPGQPDMVHLSIKNLEKSSFIPWRDKQRIKNELIGPEYEAVELFPAESRLIDTANQYHLWCVDNSSFRWPVGWHERHVSDGAGETLARQDPFEA